MMKSIIKYLALAVVAFSFAACEEELGGQNGGDLEPAFPELIENYAVEPGSTQEIVFTPNMDWKISIPSELRQWFWIQDGAFKVSELKGGVSADPITVYIGVTETPDFDRNLSCEVTLEMGESSMVVAKYMLPAKEKTLEVFAAMKVSESEFELAEDGISYVYSVEEATDLALIWSEIDKDFRLPVKVGSLQY